MLFWVENLDTTASRGSGNFANYIITKQKSGYKVDTEETNGDGANLPNRSPIKTLEYKTMDASFKQFSPNQGMLFSIIKWMS